ncbi:MAG: tRNA ((37)-N6)-threonylcarbamoyltransferase complex ATPase subunit type 1 TsaE [Bacteroidota bacterium]|jgi:tRNA threonylcarbamoyladenosine biosynthesis protein TsaE
MQVVVSDLIALKEAAAQLISFAGERRVFLFNGEMGAGKTTFIKAICEYLGVSSTVSSPTFALINEYEYPSGLVYHFDCYRLKQPTEALDFGLEEYLDSGSYCFIEWPEKIAAYWPQSYVQVSIKPLNDREREMSFNLVG